MKKSTKPGDVRSGIALALTAFIISMFLYCEPQYFGSLTKAVAVVLIFVGFASLGIELEQLTSTRRRALIDRNNDSGIFTNLGIGLAILVVWASLHHYFPSIWVNVLISILLLLSVYGMTLGLVNILFRVACKSRDEGDSASTGSIDADASQNRTKKPGSLAVKIAVAVSGVIGFVASMIQILQFLKII